MRAETVDEGERSLGKGQSALEVCSGVKGRSEPVPEPPNRVTGAEKFPFDMNGLDALRRVALAGGPPVYQFGFRD